MLWHQILFRMPGPNPNPANPVDRNSSRSTQLGELLGAYSLNEWVRALTLHVEPPLILKDLVQLLQQILHFDFFRMSSTYLILSSGHLAI